MSYMACEWMKSITKWGNLNYKQLTHKKGLLKRKT